MLATYVADIWISLSIHHNHMVLAKLSIEIELMPPISLIYAMAEVLSHWKFIWTWLEFLYKAFRAKKMANN